MSRMEGEDEEVVMVAGVVFEQACVTVCVCVYVCMRTGLLVSEVQVLSES